MIESAPLEVRARRDLAAAKPWATSRRARIGLVLLAVAFAVVGFEAVLAALPRAVTPAPLRTLETFYTRRAQWRLLTAGDPYLGFKLRPDVEVSFPFEGGTIPIRTMSHGLGPIGFRDIGTRAPFGAIVIGDSFVFCDEVVAEGCWVRRLSEATGVSMATLGVSGYSTLAEARVLRRYGPAFGVPLVLVGIFPNDLADNVNFDKWARGGTDDLTVWLERERGPHPAARWLEERSAVYRLLRGVSHARGRDMHRHREGSLDLVLRFDEWWMRIVRAPDQHPGWPLMQEALLDMRQAAADMQARLAVVIFPTKEEAYWDLARRYQATLEGVDIDGLPRLLTGFLADHGIFGCDLTGEIRGEARRGRQLYHTVSGHFNEEGNRVAAAAIARCLATGPPVDAGRPSPTRADGQKPRQG